MKLWVEHKPMSGTNVLKKVELQLITVDVQNNLQRQKMKKHPKSSESDSFQLSFDHSWSHVILTEHLGRHYVAAKFVPCLLSEDRKQKHVYVRKELVDHAVADENFLKNMTTGSDTWVYSCGVKTKPQSSHWVSETSHRCKKALQFWSNVKVMLTVFFDCEGFIRHEFLPHSQTVNKEYYPNVMKQLREAVRTEQPNLWRGKKWLLHNDNAPMHSSLLICDFLTKYETTLIPQPPYSPDLAPADLFLFTKLKSVLKGLQFESVEIAEYSLADLHSIPKEAFQKCFQNWKKH